MTVRVPFDLVEGTTRSLDAIVKDLKDGLLTDLTVTWRSDNKALATVGETTGTVKAQAKGITAIFAKLGVVETSIFINVTQAPVVSIKITADSFEVLEGNQILLSATLRDKDDNILEGRTLTWLSSDQTVAEGLRVGFGLGSQGRASDEDNSDIGRRGGIWGRHHGYTSSSRQNLVPLWQSRCHIYMRSNIKSRWNRTSGGKAAIDPAKFNVSTRT